MESSVVQSAKAAIIEFTGLGKDALHIHVGLAAFFLAAAILRKPLHSPVPWLVAVGVACLGEAVDLFDDYRLGSPAHLAANLHDILNTAAWPTILFLLARFTRLLRR